jgi:hypothetical protein
MCFQLANGLALGERRPCGVIHEHRATFRDPGAGS